MQVSDHTPLPRFAAAWASAARSSCLPGVPGNPGQADNREVFCHRARRPGGSRAQAGRPRGAVHAAQHGSVTVGTRTRIHTERFRTRGSESRGHGVNPRALYAASGASPTRSLRRVGWDSPSGRRGAYPTLVGRRGAVADRSQLAGFRADRAKAGGRGIVPGRSKERTRSRDARLGRLVRPPCSGAQPEIRTTPARLVRRLLTHDAGPPRDPSARPATPGRVRRRRPRRPRRRTRASRTPAARRRRSRSGNRRRCRGS